MLESEQFEIKIKPEQMLKKDNKDRVMEANCAVCNQQIPKDRVHYGGVSCYSCRAFFRRNTQREELPVCKSDGNCEITHEDRKQCSACRYSKCLRIGMKPENVLTEDDKKKRFKKHLKKKESEAGSGSVSDSPLWDAPSSSPSPPGHAKFPNFMTNTFQNNLQHLLFAQGAAGRASLLSANSRLSPPLPSPARSPIQTFSASPFPMMGSEFTKSPPSLSPVRDVEAARFLKSRGWFSQVPSMASPNLATHYAVSPYNHTELFMRPVIKEEEEVQVQDFSLPLRRNEERQSVITFPRLIKPEPELFREFIDPQNEESFPEQESRELGPQNLSLKRESTDIDGDEDTDDGQYVHKKFRTTVEKTEAESLVRAQLPRRSVIMHASSARI